MKKLFPSTFFQAIILILLGLILLTPVLFVLSNNHMDNEFTKTLFGLGVMLFVFFIAKAINLKRGYPLNLTVQTPKTTRLLVFSTLAIITYQLGVNAPLASVVSHFIKTKNNFSNPIEYSVFTLFSMVLIAPILEELIFRGTILKGFLLKYTPLKAILFSSILFGVIHGLPLAILNAFFFGLFFGWIYYKYNNITTVVIIHCITNLFGLISKYFQSQFHDEHNYFDVYGQWTLLIFLSSSIIFSYLTIKIIKTKNS
jgi:membrane protease YdiL (CAAX protease family)